MSLLTSNTAYENVSIIGYSMGRGNDIQLADSQLVGILPVNVNVNVKGRNDHT
jgi:hypothetical protein